MENVLEIDCNGVKLELIRIKAGSFMMGSKELIFDESLYSDPFYDDEQQHRVILTKDFWLGRYEVTQAQYEAIMGENPSYFEGSNHPVEQVNWYEAKDFCTKLNQKYIGKLPRGYNFDLPTEAQWEYACRAGTTTIFSYGDEPDTEKMNFCDTCLYGNRINSEMKSTLDVDCLGYANTWGLYDMHGNVCEWCRDWYGFYTKKTINPTGPKSGLYCVIRGGGWNDSANHCRSAFRNFCDPLWSRYNLGFRLSLTSI